ncbi:MAG: GTP-binding protein, partial [bacterium]
TAGVLDDQMLEDFFYEILPGVYRVKGIVQTNGESAWTSVNAVAGRFEMEVFNGEHPGQSTLVFIGRTLDCEDLARRCAGLLA